MINPYLNTSSFKKNKKKLINNEFFSDVFSYKLIYHPKI